MSMLLQYRVNASSASSALVVLGVEHFRLINHMLGLFGTHKKYEEAFDPCVGLPRHPCAW